MGRIKKVAGPKHEATVSQAVAEFVTAGCSLPICKLPEHLRSFPREWPFPRGDLYHWIPLLNRFDGVLEYFTTEYGLHTGPQTRPFKRILLEKGVPEENKAGTVTPSNEKELNELGYAADGDRQLIEAILHHCQLLLENCGNRSLYSSSERLGELLNTTSLSLLSATLQLTARLAQRYYTSRQRSGTANQHLSSAMLASHYNIDLEKVQKLANPFVKSPISGASTTSDEKNTAQTGQHPSQGVDANDFLSLVQAPAVANGSVRSGAISEHQDNPFQDWGGVQMTYYQPASTTKEDVQQPTVLTSVRRSSATFRPTRLSSSEELADPSITPGTSSSEEVNPGTMRIIEISASKIHSSPIEDIVKEGTYTLPPAFAYEFLTKVRIASAVTTSLEVRQEMVKVRLLAITNLVYIYPESILQQRIFQQDSEEPRRFQLVHQLSCILHPPNNIGSSVPVGLQTIALALLEALARHKAKEPDVCSALSINASHGVLFYVLRKAIAEVSAEEKEEFDFKDVDRRDATFSLLEALPRPHNRVAETLVAAGLFEILVEALNLRTATVERHRPKLLSTLIVVLQTSRESLQIFANAKGLDAMSGLVQQEVLSALSNAEKGRGLPKEFRNQTIDYQIPYIQRETLRLLCKCISNMMSSNGGNFDRLLRNLIDSPPLLGGLRTIIRNPKIYGASVWSGSVNIMSSFIHNEPTSYSIISESGLSNGLIESIGNGRADLSDSDVQSENNREVNRTDKVAPADGILPHVDAILAIPQAFGAICLNNSGKELFLRSKALNKFFEVFESAPHVSAMNTTVDFDTPRLLGSAFDELVRHHPDVKEPVLAAIRRMVRSVVKACEVRGKTARCGAKLWTQDDAGIPVPAGDQPTIGKSDEGESEDVVMSDMPVSNESSDDILEEKGASAASRTDRGTDEEKEGSTIASFIEIAMRFLAGLLENAHLASYLVEDYGTTDILHLSTLPYLPYDFNNHAGSQEVAKVIHMLAEQKPHLVLPELLGRALDATNNLRLLYEYDLDDGFFTEFTTPQKHTPSYKTAFGTTIARSLVNVQTLCNILYEVFSPPILNPRAQHTPFSQVNLTDIYQEVIRNLGLLHRVCVWEEILLQKRLPDTWREATRIKGYGMGSEEADEVFGFINNDGESAEDPDAAGTSHIEGESFTPLNGGGRPLRKGSMTKDEGTAQFKNARTLRYLLSQIPSCIIPFFQSLGKSLVAKRRPETYLRQNAYLVAEAMSKANMDQLNFDIPRRAESAKDRYAYWIVILTSISQLMIEGAIDRPHVQVLTLLLQTFKIDGGLDLIRDVLEVFYQEVNSFHANSEEGIQVDDGAARLTSAYGGIKIILSFYAQITSPKSITDSAQSSAIASSDRDRGHVHFFSAQQFLVELRLAILPNVRRLWGSDFVDKASTSIIKCLIEILTTILEAADEQDAFRRGDNLPARKKSYHKIFNVANDKLQYLTEAKEYDRDLAQEALYRCMNTQSTALEYCAHMSTKKSPSRLPIPEYDRDKPRRSSAQTGPQPESRATSSGPQRIPADSTGETTNQDRSDAADGLFLLAQGGHDGSINNPLVEIEETDSESLIQGLMPPPPAPGVPQETEHDVGDPMQMSLDLLETNPMALNQPPHIPELQRSGNQSRSSRRSSMRSPSNSRVHVPEGQLEAPEAQPLPTLDDLDDDRSKIKDKLVERILDVLNMHDDVTFELAALIRAAAMKDSDDTVNRGEIGETLIEALISFTAEEDFRASGKKIASYAHLLGICLQDGKFFDASLECLKENMISLFDFIKIFPEQSPDQSPSWIGAILLVIERVLSEDAQPALIQWSPTIEDLTNQDHRVVDTKVPIIPREEMMQLSEALLEIMPRIGKDGSLVLSVVRALVILTRYRSIALKLSEKRNIQRLFVMIKQLSGMTDQKLPGSFMILLRHIIEEEDTVRQIMRSEIAATFEARPGRPTDTLSYIRQMSHLVLRSPEIFVEVTNELIEIGKYEKDQPTQILRLKPTSKDERATESEKTHVENSRPPTDEASQVQTSHDTEQIEHLNGSLDTPKGKSVDTKAPTVDQPSGVVHFLLTELLAYKDVDDRDSASLSKSSTTQDLEEDSTKEQISNGTEASNSSTPTPLDARTSIDPKRFETSEFRLEQHPIYLYRCFILQCLTELLQSYNRVKVEFINFSRKADPKGITPSKPRSGVLNYLLNDVIPVGTLNHEDSLVYKKKTNTSNWAISSVVALCLRTNEAGYESKAGSIEEDDQADLVFVRKFVLEHALKAYKDAAVSEEHPDVKYARLLDIADLFQRLLLGRLVVPSGPIPQNTEVGFQKSIAKLMFEKNFISALTSSIADIDLNFPGSKRAIKYILRPLKQLTQTAIFLSETSSISSAPGQTDEDEISTASSVSEVGEEREETPDLFRNSTLGMFEPERDEESGSGSDEEDDEMYDEEEDEGMDFDEDADRDGDEVISEEDEELEDAGPIEGLHGDPSMDVEVVIDGEDDDDDSTDDDDDPDDSEDMDENEEMEVLDEITGDEENASLAEGEDEDELEDEEDEEEWQGDLHEAPGEYEMEREDVGGRAESAVRDLIQEFGSVEGEAHRLQGLQDGPSDLQIDINEGRYMEDVVRREDDEDVQEDEDEDREEDIEDEEEIYQPDFEDNEHGMPDPPWGFDPDDESFVHDHHHHHHHHHHRHAVRRVAEPWNVFPNGPGALRGSMPLYRSHRPGAGMMRSNDDGGHPLLQRGDRNAPAGFPRGYRTAFSDAAANLSDYWVHGMDIGGLSRGMMADSPVSFVNSIIAAIGNGTSGLTPIGPGNGGAIHVQIGGPGRGAAMSSHRSNMPELQAYLNRQHRDYHEPRGHRNEQSQAVIFPEATSQRWQQESRLIWNTSTADKATRILNSLLAVLVPPAMEEKKRQEEAAKRLREEQEKQREEERVAKEKVEAERQVKEKEEREAAERAAQEAAAQAAAEAEVPNQVEEATEGSQAGTADEQADEAMEGVEITQTDVSASTDAEPPNLPTNTDEIPPQPAERVVTMLGNREIDITGLGIDLAYLDALPEELRQEVLMSQITIQRSQAAAVGEPPSEISHEFLEALPPEIREELLQQEAQERRRREREDARRQQQTSGGGPRAEDMDPASFLASLDPTLRQHVLAEQDEEMLAHLPPEIAAEARALGGDRTMHRFAGMPGRRTPGLTRLLDPRNAVRRPSPIRKTPKKQVVRMLDKAGVATLLRLIFAPQQGSSRESFNAVLRHISENRQTRAEVVTLLLSILQDGSFDVGAVERSFTQLSLRAKQSGTPKTPQALKRTLTGSATSSSNSVEVSPLTVVQQCLSTLVSLTNANPHIPSFFLTEHDLSSGVKSKSSRKGKGKETKASKYAINSLLSLLDRKLIMESSVCLEQLANLLQSVTHPLVLLQKAQIQTSEDRGAEPQATDETNGTQGNQNSTNENEIAAEGAQQSPQNQGNVISTQENQQPAENADEQAEANGEGHQAATNGSEPVAAKDPASDQKPKKARSLTPPNIPEENLRLVVSIIAARECSKRTFQQTVATISNLKAIPGAKEVFGKGLIEQAQDLVKSILEDLGELLPQIKQAKSGADIQGLALTKFATASSHQSKLLRVLTALDYLFGSKEGDAKTKSVGESQEADSGSSAANGDDMLTTLYENSTFGPLWDKLSECLSAIRQGDGMLNIASILQPLIEALMVVCKNTSTKDSTVLMSAKEFAITSPPPESRMESLFFKFTEEHRKILNELVRHSPKLMMGTFSLLVKNPKVLEFDNKRNYFTKRLHSRGTDIRHPQPPLQLSVRRDQVFHDSFRSLSFKSGDEIKYGKLSIRFHGEEGVDAGGVTREWFQVLSRQMFNPDYALFIPVASDRTTFHPNKLSKINEEHLSFFKFIGRIIGKALYEGRALDCHFSRAVYKRILGNAVSIKDMETLDLDYYKSLLWMLENDITEIITETFSIETDDFGVIEVVDLIENGRNIPVTEENKQEYVQRVVEYRLTESIHAQLEKFLEGFHDIVSPELISIFNEQELELLISGLPDIDVDDWKNHTEYHNYQASSPQIQWFWRAVRSFDKEERAKLLQFVTGTSKVPLNGFGQLEGMNGFSRFNIHRDYGNKERLPSSHTCFNQLDLPEYESYESLRKHLYTAMTAGNQYFGFA